MKKIALVVFLILFLVFRVVNFITKIEATPTHSFSTSSLSTKVENNADEDFEEENIKLVKLDTKEFNTSSEEEKDEEEVDNNTSSEEEKDEEEVDNNNTSSEEEKDEEEVDNNITSESEEDEEEVDNNITSESEEDEEEVDCEEVVFTDRGEMCVEPQWERILPSEDFNIKSKELLSLYDTAEKNVCEYIRIGSIMIVVMCNHQNTKVGIMILESRGIDSDGIEYITIKKYLEFDNPQTLEKFLKKIKEGKFPLF